MHHNQTLEHLQLENFMLGLLFCTGIITFEMMKYLVSTLKCEECEGSQGAELERFCALLIWLIFIVYIPMFSDGKAEKTLFSD